MSQRHACVIRCCCCRKRIVDVIFAVQRPGHFSDLVTFIGLMTQHKLLPQRIFHPIGPAQRTRLTGGAKPFKVRPTALTHYPRQRLFSCGLKHTAVGRHRADHMVELALNGGDIGKNIGMVKFQIIQHSHIRSVVNKLRAFVEKCAVVFIRFDDKRGIYVPQCR